MATEKERSGYHHGDLRSALLDEALSLIEERGVEGLSLREVARRAGVSRAAPYHHFRNKEAMTAAVAERGFAQLVTCMSDISSDLSPLEQLEASGHAYIRFAITNPTLYRLMFGSKVQHRDEHPELEDTSRCAFQLLEDRLQCLDPTRSGAELGAFAMAVWGSVHGMASLVIDDLGPYDATDRHTVDHWVQTVMDLLREGLRGAPRVGDQP